MNRRTIQALLGTLFVAALPTTVYAHTGESGVGFVSGLLHPILGPDHFLAMLSVGIVSAQLGGRRIFTIPGLFVVAMVTGAVIGIYGFGWPFSELGIALSVVILGIAIATTTSETMAWPIFLVVALFGSLHGHAHGLEMPGSADPVYYGGGFVLSTACIHMAGVGVGHWFTSRETLVTPLRHLGSGMAGMGAMILLNLLEAW
ncbi:MAG: HupE/UreJ family protein [Acidobacteriota bacterium]|jgi:urease accessory protein